MADLIELLRALARHEHSDVSIAEEAAAALEAAREDAANGAEYQRGFRDGYERRHLEVLGALA